MSEIDDIKSRLDIVDFVSHYVTLKKAGSNYKGLCPFHEERTPSFMVSPEKQIFKCFGCGEGGDIFAFLMKQDNLEFREALEVLAEKTGVQLKKFQTPNVKSQISSKSQLFQINMASAHLWHKILTDHAAGKTALEYLRKRKLSDKTIKQWLIGYAPSQDTTRMFLTKRGFNAEQIKAAGAPDRFFGRIMFPLFDVIGNVLAFTGREMANPPAGGPKYLNTAESALYHKSRFIYGLNAAKAAIKKQDRVIVVEGQMDVVASHQSGVTNVVATSGTALTKDHLMILARYTPNIVLAFDNDEAGLKATKSALDLALGLELTVRIIAMPAGFKDVGELAQRAPEKWLKISAEAIPWLEFLLHQFPAAFSLEDKKKAAKEILPFLARVKDPIEKSHWIKKLASFLNVKEEAVIDSLAKIQNPNSKIQKEQAKPAKQISLEEELYGLMLVFPNLQKDRQQLFERLKNWYNKDTSQLELIVKERYQDVNDGNVAATLAGIISRLKERKTAGVKDDFAIKIAQAEQAGDREKVRALFKQLQDSLKK